MEHRFDTSVLIGRFEPFHNGHMGLLRKAFEIAPHTLVLLGSAFQSPSPRNPFSAEEREEMIRGCLRESENARVQFLYQRDYWNSARWASQSQKAVHALLPSFENIVLVGHHKDPACEYLNRFPGWTYFGVGSQGDIDATTIRNAFFKNALPDVQAMLPPNSFQWLTEWMKQTLFSELQQESEAITQYQIRWGKGPFVTTDAIVEAAGHVLMIRRGKRPGKGQLALPGGFLEIEEAIVDGALRELYEETGLRLSGSEAEPRSSMLFAHPGRSLRARIITHAEYFVLDTCTPPEVRGGDDAADAFWIPIDQLQAMESQFFEDHFHILDQCFHLTGTDL